MSDPLGPMEIECDAPSYPIVRACQRLGFHSPQDVRWCRVSRRGNQRSDWRQFLRRPWQLLLGTSEASGNTCFCGQALPAPEMYTFTLISGKEVYYLMGQCGQCHTIFWDQAQSAIGG